MANHKQRAGGGAGDGERRLANVEAFMTRSRFSSSYTDLPCHRDRSDASDQEYQRTTPSGRTSDLRNVPRNSDPDRACHEDGDDANPTMHPIEGNWMSFMFRPAAVQAA